MSLLAILISLALEKFLPALNGLRNLNWIPHYQQWIHARLTNHPKWQGLPSLLIIILLPVIGTAARITTWTPSKTKTEAIKTAYKTTCQKYCKPAGSPTTSPQWMMKPASTG